MCLLGIPRGENRGSKGGRIPRVAQGGGGPLRPGGGGRNMRGLMDLGPLGGRPGGPGGKWGGGPGPPRPLLLRGWGATGDSIEDPAELGYILGGTEVDLPVGGAMAAGRPRGLDNLLDEGSLHRVAVSTSEGDCPLEKMR